MRSKRDIAPTVFIPLLLVMITLAVQAFTARAGYSHQLNLLVTQQRQQDPVVEQARTLRQQLESIAGATAALAEQGNPNAIIIRDQLKSQGVSIQAPQANP